MKINIVLNLTEILCPSEMCQIMENRWQATWTHPLSDIVQTNIVFMTAVAVRLVEMVKLIIFCFVPQSHDVYTFQLNQPAHFLLFLCFKQA